MLFVQESQSPAIQMFFSNLFFSNRMIRSSSSRTAFLLPLLTHQGAHHTREGSFLVNNHLLLRNFAMLYIIHRIYKDLIEIKKFYLPFLEI